MNILGLIGRSRQFEERLEQSRERLFRLAYSWCRNSAVADDLVQETLSKALAKSSQLRKLDALHVWLVRILANCWRDQFRGYRETEDVTGLGDDQFMHEVTPEYDYLQSEIVKRVRTAVGELPVGQRQVVTLVDLEEFSYAEVASILNIPVGTVMSRLSRARLALKGSLLDHQPVAAVAHIARVK